MPDELWASAPASNDRGFTGFNGSVGRVGDNNINTLRSIGAFLVLFASHRSTMGQKGALPGSGTLLPAGGWDMLTHDGPFIVPVDYDNAPSTSSLEFNSLIIGCITTGIIV